MALSGSVSTSDYEGRYYKVSWSATQDIANNKSTISWSLSAVGGSATWYAERTLKVVIAGTTVYSKTARTERYTGTIDSGTVTINHNTEGAASFSISLEAAVYVSNVNCTGSDTFTLNTIPRKSTLSVGNGVLGKAQTLTVTRQSTSFTHTIVASCGNLATTICEKSSNASISFTPPINWASKNTTGTSVSVLYQISTYSGNTFIDYVEYTVTCSIPDTVIPTCSLTVSEGATLSAVYGTYMQNLSKLKIKVTASGSQGSTIKSISTDVYGTKYTSSEFTTGVITMEGLIPITCIVTDSRGRTFTYTTSVTVTKYSPPIFTSLNAYRSTEHGASDDQGEYITVSCSAEYPCYWNSSKWNVNCQLRYVKTSENTFTAIDMQPTSSEFVTSTDYMFRLNYMYTFPADIDYSYNIEVVCTDIYGKSGKMSTSVSTAFTIMHLPVDGVGIGFGKVVENEGHFEVGQPAKFFSDLEVVGKLSFDMSKSITVRTYTVTNVVPNDTVLALTSNMFGYHHTIDLSVGIQFYGTPIAAYAYNYCGMPLPVCMNMAEQTVTVNDYYGNGLSSDKKVTVNVLYVK